MPPLPAWMNGYPGAPKPAETTTPKPTHPAWMAGHLPTQPDTDEQPVSLKPCTCRGEGCTACGGDGAIYP